MYVFRPIHREGDDEFEAMFRERARRQLEPVLRQSAAPVIVVPRSEVERSPSPAQAAEPSRA